MMNHKDFVIFIISYGRPGRVYTYKTLKKQNYTGKIIVLVDNEDDEMVMGYEKEFPKEVYVFDKKTIENMFDVGDNFPGRRGNIYARNASFEIAEKLGYKYFAVFDDDYTRFNYKCDAAGNYTDKKIRNLDRAFDALLDYYESAEQIKSLAIAQGGDFIGGKRSSIGRKRSLLRKCMNTFICSIDRKFQFFGRINEDVNTYVCSGGRGLLFLTVTNLEVKQKQTQASKGGLTGLYLDFGTYVKSFYSIMYAPSCVKIMLMGYKTKRIHHAVNWKCAVPCIVSEDQKKDSPKP